MTPAASNRRSDRRRPRALVDPRPDVGAGPAVAASARPRTATRTPNASSRRPTATVDDAAFRIRYCVDCGTAELADASHAARLDCFAARAADRAPGNR